MGISALSAGFWQLVDDERLGITSTGPFRLVVKVEFLSIKLWVGVAHLHARQVPFPIVILKHVEDHVLGQRHRRWDRQGKQSKLRTHVCSLSGLCCSAAGRTVCQMNVGVVSHCFRCMAPASEMRKSNLLPPDGWGVEGWHTPNGDHFWLVICPDCVDPVDNWICGEYDEILGNPPYHDIPADPPQDL